MLKLLKLAVVLGLVAAAIFLLPFGGRTLFDRWRVARGSEDFATRLWAEMRGVAPARDPAATRKPRPGKSPGTAEPAAPDQPLERTTEAERRSLDKLLDQHLSEKPKR